MFSEIFIQMVDILWQDSERNFQRLIVEILFLSTNEDNTKVKWVNIWGKFLLPKSIFHAS